VMKKAAVRAGMRTLLEDGVDKAARGLTTLDEVLRAVSRGDSDRPAETLAGASEGNPADHAAAAPPASPPPAAVVPPPALGELAPAGAAAPANRGRVLVVEDSPTISAVVRYFLELEGFEVLVAPDGQVGLDMAFRESPDVIVSDVMMPNMGGMEMVKALRADPRTAQIRILMLTSESSVESETEGLEAGADDYILKPVEPRRLAARVRALRARSRPTAA